MRRALIIGVTSAVFLLILFLFFGVWPTMYRYNTVRLRSVPNQLVRTNRITGTAEVLSDEGWVVLAPPNKSSEPPDVLPASTFQKPDPLGIEHRAGLTDAQMGVTPPPGYKLDAPPRSLPAIPNDPNWVPPEARKNSQ